MFIVNLLRFMNLYVIIGAGPPPSVSYRITELGDIRITMSGDPRIVE
jgi:hypothetical protein